MQLPIKKTKCASLNFFFFFFFYGLKQALKQWFKKFNNTLVNNNFKVNSSDTCVYLKLSGIEYVIICLYVDNMFIFGTNIDVINNTKLLLLSHFKMKDLGEVDVILGVKIRKTENGFSLCQSHYIEVDVLLMVLCYECQQNKKIVCQQSPNS